MFVILWAMFAWKWTAGNELPMLFHENTISLCKLLSIFFFEYSHLSYFKLSVNISKSFKANYRICIDSTEKFEKSIVNHLNLHSWHTVSVHPETVDILNPIANTNYIIVKFSNLVVEEIYFQYLNRKATSIRIFTVLKVFAFRITRREVGKEGICNLATIIGPRP